MSGVTIIAIILIVLVVAGIANAGVTPGTGPSRQSPRKAKRDNRYRGIKKKQQPIMQRRAEHRRNSFIETAKSHWQQRIDRANARANAADRRAQRRMIAGKPPGRSARTATKHDKRARELTGHQNREVGFAKRLWDMAAGGHPQAQKLIGRVHPKTGETVGGVGRAGHRPSDHVPPPPKSKNNGGSKK